MIYDPPARAYLSVVYCDDRLLVVSKPSGLLSVPGRKEEHADCVVSRVKLVFPSALIVHRLDMETSGILVFGLDADAHRNISKQFEAREVFKAYIARVFGNVEGEIGQVDLPLRCDWPNRPRQMVDHIQGKSAQTDWSVMEREEGVTRVLLKPITGRSHQLRVHMLSLGYPIVGDGLYATGDALAAADRLQLHAERMVLAHPDDGREISLYDPCPF